MATTLTVDGIEVILYTNTDLDAIENNSLPQTIDAYYWQIPSDIRNSMRNDNALMIMQLKNLWPYKLDHKFLDLDELMFPTLRVLHWWPIGKPSGLDERVASRLALSTDFAESIITDYGRMWCRNCGKTWHSLNVSAIGGYYSSPFEIYDAKFTKRLEARSFLACPNCQNRLRQFVVKIFREVSDDEAFSKPERIG